MPTHMQQIGNAILNAMDEARVSAVIKLVDDGRIIHPTDWGTSRYERIRNGCEYLGVKDIDC